ncbi:hypothetical protein L3V82_00360 [Thiotrichales bacterium 19S3-7]|nr:hypothetical protein [Thiotrichales bacterium 19S3-7]MCF6800615.1 hypothetical protein [Thiotrichales bacterium 19S3-11]
MSWRTIFEKSKSAKALESKLNFRCVEHQNLPSTANTDVETKTINLDISQNELKTALSFIYELKNFENADKYHVLIGQARSCEISKSKFVHGMLTLEAEAMLFRTKAFKEMGLDDSEFPNNRAYLDIYNNNLDLSDQELIKLYKKHSQSNGVVRKQFAATKYYADSYKHHAEGTPFPIMYTETNKSEVIMAEYSLTK